MKSTAKTGKEQQNFEKSSSNTTTRARNFPPIPLYCQPYISLVVYQYIQLTMNNTYGVRFIPVYSKISIHIPICTKISYIIYIYPFLFINVLYIPSYSYSYLRIHCSLYLFFSVHKCPLHYQNIPICTYLSYIYYINPFLFTNVTCIP